MDRGYQWLLGYIQSNWTGLSSRVEIETKEQIKLEQEVMRKRIEKFRNQGNQENQINQQDGERHGSDDINRNELIIEDVEKENTIHEDSDFKEKVITQRRFSVNEPRERTVLIFGSLDQLDKIVEEDESTINPQNNQSQSTNDRRPKSSSLGERKNSNFRFTISRNQIAPL